MINKFKNYPLLLCLLSATAALISYVIITRYAHPYFFGQTQVLQNKEIDAKQFTQQVDMLMTSTWNQLEATSGVTLTHCKEYVAQHTQELEAALKENNNLILQKFGAVTKETQALVSELLDDFQIDPKALTIIKYEAPYFLAGVDDVALFISEDNLKTYGPKAQRFILAHELAHYKNKDQSIETALGKLLNLKDAAQQACVNTFTRSTEFRADLIALLKGKKYTEGALEFFQEYINRYGDCNSATHPQPSKRLKIAQDIHALYSKENFAVQTA